MSRERVPYEPVFDPWGRVVKRFLHCPWCGNEIDRRAKGRHARWHHRPVNCWTQEEIDRAKAEGLLYHVALTGNETDMRLLTPFGYVRPLYVTEAEMEEIQAILRKPPNPTPALIAALATRWETKVAAAKDPSGPEALVTCEHCSFPHPLNDDGTRCLYPKAVKP